MRINKETIAQDYPHRIEADGTGTWGCPVCCGDGETDDRRYGGTVRRVLDADNPGTARTIRECKACDVWGAK